MLGERRLHRDIDNQFRGSGVAGQLRLVNDPTPLRAGETLAGARIRVSAQTKSLYAETSPKLIFHSAVFLVAVSTLPANLQKIFTDPDSTRTLVDWPLHCFRDIYNTHYATPDLALSPAVDPGGSDPMISIGDLVAPVPDLIQTMAVVGDDELEPNYRELIYMQTGFQLPEMGCEQLSSRTSVMNFGESDVVSGERAARLMDSHTHSIDKNYVAAEYSFLCTVMATWVEPYRNQLKYDQGPATLDATAFQNALMYQEQGRMDSTVLATQNDWILRLTDAPNELGQGVGAGSNTEAAINLFEGGSVTLLADSRVPRMVDSSGEYVPAISAASTITAASLAPGQYEHYIDCWGGASILTDLGLF